MNQHSVRDILHNTTQELRQVSDTARLDAEVLLADTWGCERLDLVARQEQLVPTDVVERLTKLLKRRVQGEPVAYLIGQKEFWGLKLQVAPSVLIPRPETELLVERALAAVEKLRDPLLIADLGTGSGCIAVAVAHELMQMGRDFHMVAVDISLTALEIAAKNVISLGLSQAVSLLASNWLAALQSSCCFDLILCNPPYVDPSQRDDLAKELSYEPATALFASMQGLSDLQQVLRAGLLRIKPGGKLLLEIGNGQLEELAQYLNTNLIGQFDSFVCYQDLAGHNRALEVSAKPVSH